MRKMILYLIVLLFIATFYSCDTTHTVKVEPMHITIDVNVKIDKALDDFFDEIDEAEETVKPSNPKN